ncbi:mannose-1-phosphate guanylyltransferase/mannose-6-phosphate isomerase [Photobacterium minamisatsumaniensis]|uniref:mannose-1-phosphate guanylyltransferase/mannose-6-phosphate isomerase n=1 Tax=Photobacterium minamisatsumaniensis TaxID=2910233 RepID=UPI003D096752
MSSDYIIPVIMAGGSGSRLWPLSRTHYPKQFLPLASESSLLQETLFRCEALNCLPSIVISNENHRFIIAEQLRQADCQHQGIILEPEGRNTAPAIALAALQALQQGTDPLLLVLAADHVIKQPEMFHDSVLKAVPMALQGKLVTFGIVPDHPETGYGYIRQGDALNADHSIALVDAFIEKPERQAAEEYVDAGYLWNSGMFLFRASSFLNELELFYPEILKACQKAFDGRHNDLDFIRLNNDAFLTSPSESIDYAVMEKTEKAAVVAMDAGWSDVGSWDALWDVTDKDGHGNATRGDVITESSRNCYVYSQHRLVSMVGTENLIVVETKDAVLVAQKDSVQDIKKVVAYLHDNDRKEHLQHREIYRPWGSHDAITEGDRYHVKKVKVKPGEKTAVQVHFNRAEHWIVVVGTARVRNGDRTYLVSENESTYIPIGAEHAFENPGKSMLELIEVRTGRYLGEDDIVRIDSQGEGYE